MPPPPFDDAARRCAETLIELAFAEDLGTPMPGLSLNVPAGRIELTYADRPDARAIGDLTSTVMVPENARWAGQLVARAGGVIAGMPVLRLVADRFGLASWYRPLVADGDPVEPGTRLADFAGPARSMLAMERTALNFLQRLGGIASLTARFVEAVAGTRAVILDTRKTTPGWRALEKYAVCCGGGRNHRTGLYDAVLIKDNHLAWLASLGDAEPIAAAISSARRMAPEADFVEVEVDSLAQLDRALECRPDIILVDNFGVDGLIEAVRRRDEKAPGILLEASGGVRLETVATIARTGVDRISVGALTHSAPALDIALDFDSANEI